MRICGLKEVVSVYCVVCLRGLTDLVTRKVGKVGRDVKICEDM